ncbi:MAG: hypothetical protein ACI92C_001051, partial [Neolewinella sp.]
MGWTEHTKYTEHKEAHGARRESIQNTQKYTEHTGHVEYSLMIAREPGS